MSYKLIFCSNNNNNISSSQVKCDNNSKQLFFTNV